MTLLNTIEVTIGGRRFDDWTMIEIIRTLHELAGSFRLEYDDQARIDAALPRAAERYGMITIALGNKVEIKVDGELLLRGVVEDVDWDIDADKVQATISGYDPGGALQECTANPNGPVEYRNLTVTEIITRLVQPFGVTVRAETAVGAPIPLLSIDLGESVLSVMDKAAKLRGVMIVSDGIGGLVITNSGKQRAPEALSLPGNVVSRGSKRSMKERFHDYWVKGRARRGKRGTAPGITTEAHPLPSREDGAVSSHARRAVSAVPSSTEAYALGAGPPTAATPAATRKAAIVGGVGHAVDPAVPGYRPRVWVARTQAGGAPNQVLAEWRMRLARGRSMQDRYTVAGWRGGEDDRLWRPNEVVSVAIGPGQAGGGSPPYDMLIEAVTLTQTDRDGTRTQLGVVGREAYDLEPLPDEHHGRHTRAKGSDVTRGATGRGRR